MKTQVSFILVLGSILSARLAVADSWLSPKVQSTYKDEKTHQEFTITGSGFLGRVGRRYFLISDSHLSQGQNPVFYAAFRAGEKPLAVKKNVVGGIERLADNDSDLEIIELERLESGGTPIFTYNSKTEYFETEEGRGLGKNLNCLQVARGYCAVVPPEVEGVPESFQLESMTILRRDTVGNPWGLTLSFGLTDFIMDSRIVSGMSGAPLLATLNGRTAIAGLSKAFHRFFPRSYFSTSLQINELLQKYLAGERGLTSSTRWRYREDIGTFRDFGEGTVEINPDAAFAGGGESGDGGLTGKKKELARTGSFSALGLKAGMLWQGRSILAFRAGKKMNGKLQDAISVYANRSGEKFVEKLTRLRPDWEFESIEEISGPISLAELLRARLAGMPAGRPRQDACLIDTNALKKNRIRLLLLKPWPLELYRKAGPEVAVEYKAYRIELDSQGAIPGSGRSQFEPLILLEGAETNKNLAHTMAIDLKGLFFVDVSQADQPLNDLSKDSLQSDFLSRYARSPYVTYPIVEGLKAIPILCYPLSDSSQFQSPAVEGARVIDLSRTKSPERGN